jgi:hypothetical protein
MHQFSAAAGGFMGLSWGLKQVAAAKKWRQEYGEPSPEGQAEIKSSHSVSNLPILLGYLVLGIVLLAFAGLVFVSIFHYQGVQLVHRNADSFPPLTMPTSTNAWQLLTITNH